MKARFLVALAALLTSTTAFAQGFPQITWVASSSTYNGAPFYTYDSLGLGTTSLELNVPGTAYGRTVQVDPTINSNYDLFFLSNEPLYDKPTLAQSELSNTVVPAGTELSLVFRRSAIDAGGSALFELRIAVMTANGLANATYEVIDNATFRIRATIPDPVPSASGDVGAAFGIIFQTQFNSDDREGTSNYAAENNLVVTNLHYLDLALESAADLRPGSIGFRAKGVDGTATDFYTYFPLKFFREFGISEGSISSLFSFYVDGVKTTGGVELMGTYSDLGFAVADPLNPNNTIHRAKVTYSSWAAPHVFQFGRIDEAAPVITVKKNQVSRKSTFTLKGAITDDSALLRFGGSYCPTTVRNCDLSGKEVKIKINGNKWSATLKNLRRGKNFIRLTAVDNLGNERNQSVIVKY